MLVSVLLLLLLFAPAAAATRAADPPALLWPMPRSISVGRTDVGVARPAGGFFSGVPASCKTLQAAFARYDALTFPHATQAASSDGAGGAAVITGLVLDVADLDESHPQLGHNESYSLVVPDTGGDATLQAPNIYAALHGLETFSQLVVFDFDTEQYLVPAAPVTIHDAPRFPHRGLMIDSARHFETLQSIRNIIDSLPYAKINVLHVSPARSTMRCHIVSLYTRSS